MPTRGKLPAAGTLVGCLVMCTATLLTGCGEKTTAKPSQTSTSLSAVDIADQALRTALSFVPRQTGQVVFTAPRNAMQRWGMANLSSASISNANAINAYVAKAKSSAATSVLGGELGVMSDWGWGPLDIDWEISMLDADSPTTVIKLQDSVAMKTVTDSLIKHGMVAGKPAGGGVPYTVGPNATKTLDVTEFTQGVTVFAADHVVVLGQYAAKPSAGASLETDPVVSRAVATPTELDYAAISTGSSACVPAGHFPVLGALASSGTPGGSSSPVAYAQVLGTAAMVLDDTHQEATAVYPDADTAGSDSVPRQLLVSEGVSSAGKPFITLLGARVQQQGSVLTYALHAANSKVVPGLVVSRDTPWAACGS